MHVVAAAVPHVLFPVLNNTPAVDWRPKVRVSADPQFAYSHAQTARATPYTNKLPLLPAPSPPARPHTAATKTIPSDEKPSFLIFLLNRFNLKLHS